jgi:hypothetical protein
LRSDDHADAAREATTTVTESTTNTNAQDKEKLFTKQAKRSISAASLDHGEEFLDSPRARSEDHNFGEPNDVDDLDERSNHRHVEPSPPTYMAMAGDSPVISPINSQESPDSSEEEKIDWTIALTGEQFTHKQLTRFMNLVIGSEVFSGEVKVPGLVTTHHWIRVPNEHRKVFVKSYKNLKPEITDVALERIQKLKYVMSCGIINVRTTDIPCRQFKHKYLLDILAYSEEPLTVITDFMKNGKTVIFHESGN